MRVEIPPDRPRVDLPLPSGEVLTLVPLAPSDRQYIEEGFEELSPESRYARFGLGLESLTHSELEYLSNVDQRHHVGWGAVVHGEGAGVGRYIVVDGDSADVAITVVDKYQGSGVGTTLLMALAAVAAADGLRGFQVDITPANRRVVDWLTNAGVPLSQGEDGLIKGKIPLEGVVIPDADRLVAAMEEFRARTPEDRGRATPS
ncbi:MAG TPA: GNAT family N-acetyltransferase [Acidimicrobiia bacterium]